MGVEDENVPLKVTHEQLAYARTLNHGQDPLEITWVNEVSDPQKQRRRLVVIGEHFVVVLKRGRWSKLGLAGQQVAHRGHLFKLQQFGLFRSKPNGGADGSRPATGPHGVDGGQSVVALVFDAFTVRFLDVGPRLLQALALAVMRISYQFPDETLPEVSEETSKAIAGLEDPRRSLRPADGHRATYLAMCAQEEIPPRQSVLDHLEEVLGALPAKSEPDPASGPDEFELDLAKCFGNKSKDVTAKDVLCIASFVACSKWFTSLCMCKLVPPADSGVKIVFNAVAANQVLQRVRVNYSLKAQQMQKVLALCPSAAEIDFSHNDLGDKGLQYLAKALNAGGARKGAARCVPRVLQVERCQVRGAGAAELASACLNTRAWTSSLAVLNLSRNALGATGTLALVPFLRGARALHTLQLAECALELHEVFGAVRQNAALLATLQVLDVSYNRFSDEAALRLKPFLVATTALEVLMLRKVDPTPGACMQLFSGLFGNAVSEMKLQLDLSKNNLMRTTAARTATKSDRPVTLATTCIATIAQEIRAANNFCLHKLLLEKCSLGPWGVSSLAAALHERQPEELEVLSLYGNLMESNEAVSAWGGQEGASHADVSMSMARLSFMVNQLPLVAFYLTGDAAAPLRQHLAPLLISLSHNITLKVLNISDQHGGDVLAFTLSEMLKINTVLQELTWDGNDTTAEGFSMFFAGLRCNSTLFDMPVPVKDVAAQLKLLRKEGNEVGAKALEQTRSNIERQLLQNLHMKRKAIAGATMRGAALKKHSTIGSVSSEAHVGEVTEKDIDFMIQSRSSRAASLHGDALGVMRRYSAADNDQEAAGSGLEHSAGPNAAGLQRSTSKEIPRNNPRNAGPSPPGTPSHSPPKNRSDSSTPSHKESDGATAGLEYDPPRRQVIRKVPSANSSSRPFTVPAAGAPGPGACSQEEAAPPAPRAPLPPVPPVPPVPPLSAPPAPPPPAPPAPPPPAPPPLTPPAPPAPPPGPPPRALGASPPPPPPPVPRPPAAPGAPPPPPPPGVKPPAVSNAHMDARSQTMNAICAGGFKLRKVPPEARNIRDSPGGVGSASSSGGAAQAPFQAKPPNSGNSRGDMLAMISAGVKLKSVNRNASITLSNPGHGDAAPPPPKAPCPPSAPGAPPPPPSREVPAPPPAPPSPSVVGRSSSRGSGGRSSLLAQINAGNFQLKKVQPASKNAKSPLSAPMEGGESGDKKTLWSMLMEGVENVRSAVGEDQSDNDSFSDDD